MDSGEFSLGSLILATKGLIGYVTRILHTPYHTTDNIPQPRPQAIPACTNLVYFFHACGEGLGTRLNIPISRRYIIYMYAHMHTFTHTHTHTHTSADDHVQISRPGSASSGENHTGKQYYLQPCVSCHMPSIQKKCYDLSLVQRKTIDC